MADMTAVRELGAKAAEKVWNSGITVTPVSSQMTFCGVGSQPVPRWLRWLHKPWLAVGERSVKVEWVCKGCGFRSRADFFVRKAIRLECGFCKAITKIAHSPT